MKKALFLFLLLCLFAVLATSILGAEASIPTIETSEVRVQLLSSSVIRVEEAVKGAFLDDATLMIQGREDFSGVDAEISETADAITAKTDSYTVVVKKNVSLSNGAVFVCSPDNTLMWTYASAVNKAEISSSPKIITSGEIYYNYPNGDPSNSGFSAKEAKHGWGGSAGTAALLKGGGTLVFSGRGYIGNNYTLPKTSSPVLFTGVGKDGTDYRHIGSMLDSITGSFSPKTGCEFVLQNDAVFDDIILLSSGGGVSTIRIKGSSAVLFGEGVTSHRLKDNYPHLAISVEAGSVAIIRGGEFSFISGSGTVVVTEETAKMLTKKLLSAFTGTLLYPDGDSLCENYIRHSYNDGICSVCGKEEENVPYVPLSGFYAELPEPCDTPDIFAISDYPRVIPSDRGFVYSKGSGMANGWKRSDAKDIYLFLSMKDSALLRSDFVRLIGRTPIPNIKTLGSWYCRYQDWGETQYYEIIENYKKHGFPLDVLVVDTKWRSGEDGTGYDINTALFPDMEGYLTKTEEMGILTFFNDHSRKTSDSMLSVSELKHYTENLTKLLNMGLDGWWYDRNWSYSLKSPYGEITASTMGKVMYESIIDAQNGDRRVLLLSNADWNRNGTIESAPSLISHRYGIQWTGDVTSEALQLREELTNMVWSSAIGGSPYLSSDLGGFKRAAQQSEEMYLRWMQYGALSPIFRIHSTMSSSKEINKLPYTYSEETQAILKDYMNMRYNLLPLFYTLANESYEKGLPLCRRLDLIYPQYEESRSNTEYLLGNDILVAPIWTAEGEGDDVIPESWYKDGAIASYYRGTDPKGTPIATEKVEKIDFEWLNNSPHPAVSTDGFSVIYEGEIVPKEDCYLTIVSDDGARVYLNNELIIDAFTASWLVSNTNEEKLLKAGETYNVKVEYYDASGGAACRLVYTRITNKGESARDVFIPDGRWIDAFTGEVHEGPKTIRVSHGISSSPIFIREGAVIPTVKAVSPIAAADFSSLSLNIFSGNNGEYTLYEDDGETEGYENGIFRKTDIKNTNEEFGGRLSISAADGSFETDYTERAIALRIFSDEPILYITVNGEKKEAVKLQKEEGAFPFLDSGASAISDIYEVKLTLDIKEDTEICYYEREVQAPETAAPIDDTEAISGCGSFLSVHTLLLPLACIALLKKKKR